MDVCKHVAAGTAPLFATVEKAPAEVRGFCAKCLIKDVIKAGYDPSTFIVGYLVYRTFDADAPPSAWERLTPTPIREKQYDDPDAHKGYYYFVTAVNALGQESAPVGPLKPDALR
jgi:hypothetical protein